MFAVMASRDGSWLRNQSLLNKYMGQKVLKSNSQILHGLFPFSLLSPKWSLKPLSLPDRQIQEPDSQFPHLLIQTIKRENLTGSAHQSSVHSLSSQLQLERGKLSSYQYSCRNPSLQQRNPEKRAGAWQQPSVYFPH